MAQDMKKVPLGTHYTPLGSHPENQKDLTPVWVAQCYLIAMVVVLVLWIINLIANKQYNPSPFSGLFVLIYGASFLNRVVSNRRQRIRYFDLVFSIFMIGSGIYFFFKP